MLAYQAQLRNSFIEGILPGVDRRSHFGPAPSVLLGTDREFSKVTAAIFLGHSELLKAERTFEQIQGPGLGASSTISTTFGLTGLSTGWRQTTESINTKLRAAPTVSLDAIDVETQSAHTTVLNRPLPAIANPLTVHSTWTPHSLPN
jgi:hypothetical protein